MQSNHERSHCEVQIGWIAIYMLDIEVHGRTIPRLPNTPIPSRHAERSDCRLLGLIEDVGTVATAAVLAVVHSSHEDTSTALRLRALAPQTLNLAIAIDLVVLEHSELGLLALVLDLLGRGVHLLLPLLATAAQAEDQVERRLLLDVVVGEGAAVFELLAGEDETLLVRWDALLVCRV